MRKMVLVMMMLVGLAVVNVNAAPYATATIKANVELALNAGLIDETVPATLDKLMQERKAAYKELFASNPNVEELKARGDEIRKTLVEQYLDFYKDNVEILFADHPEINWAK